MSHNKSTWVLAAVLFTLSMDTNAQTFGRYADCTTGRGLCGVSTDNIGDENPLRIGTQKFFIRPKTDSTLELVLIKANITTADEYKIFGASLASLPLKKPASIFIDVAVPLDEAQRSRLGIAAKYTAIAAGEYAVVVTETFFISELKLQ